jgi:hypothetical protein
MIARLAVRTWARYVAPLTLLAALALVPWLVVAHGLPIAADAHGMRVQLAIAWLLTATVVFPQLALVACVAPLTRSIVAGRPLLQRRALVHGVAQLARAIAPTLVIAIAVALGMVALVVPGLVLAVLLATTNASTSLGEPLPAPLVDSAEAARRDLRRAATVLAAVLVIDFGLTLVLQLVMVPRVGTPAPRVELAHARTFVRTLAFAWIVASPICASVLAASRSASVLPASRSVEHPERA